jgi:transcriptional regulator with XRE-family HTH domain
MSLFNTALLRARLNAAGLTINELANRLDLSNTTIENVLAGHHDPGELRIATLAKFADILGLPLTSIFARNDIPNWADANTGSDPRDDAHQLIACLHAATAKSSTTTVTSAFRWTLQRTKAAITEANKRLAPSGLRLIATNGEVYLATIDDHTDALQRLATEQTSETGFRLDQYKAAYQLLATGNVTVSNTAARRRAQILNPLAAMGVITQPVTPSEGPVTVTDAARFAFL